MTVFIEVGETKVKFEVVPSELHPIDDPELPSYQSSQYQKAYRDCEFCEDMYVGKSSWLDESGSVINGAKLKRYLPSFEAEESNDYVARYQFTGWSALFPSPVNRSSGYLSHITFHDSLCAPLKLFWGDIDSIGSSLPSFFIDADKEILKNQMCVILVDAPKDDNGRAYLKIIQRENVLGYQYRGKHLSKIRIKDTSTVSTGQYSEDIYTRYIEYFEDGSYQISTLVYDNSSSQKAKILPAILEIGHNSINTLPIVVYSFDRFSPFTERSPFYNIAQLQLEYYRLKSQDTIALIRTNFPLFIQTIKSNAHSGTFDASKKQDAVALSSSKILQFYNDSSLEILMPDTSWAQVNENRLQTIKNEINNQGDEFLGLLNSSSKTELQTSLEQTILDSRINVLKERKLQTLNAIEKLFCLYYNQPHNVHESGSNFIIGSV